MPAAAMRWRIRSGEAADPDAVEGAGREAQAAVEVVDADAHDVGRRPRAGGGRHRARRAARARCRAGRDLARDAVDAHQSPRLASTSRSSTASSSAKWSPRLGADLVAVGQPDDPVVLVGQLQLALGQHHPVRQLAAQLGLPQRLAASRAARRRAAPRRRCRRRRSSRRRRRSGAARPPPRRPGTAAAGRRSGACRTRRRAPMRKLPWLAPWSGAPRVMMRSTSRPDARGAPPARPAAGRTRRSRAARRRAPSRGELLAGTAGRCRTASAGRGSRT